MNRRTLLRELGTVGAGVAVAGCVADRGNLEGSDDTGGNDTEGNDGTGGGNETSGSDGEGGSDDGTTTDGQESVPTIESRSITTGESKCGSRNDATVAFEDAAVTVDGTVGASDPCREAVLNTVEYDAEADELRLAVGTTDVGDDVCTECIAEVQYDARVEFSNGLPARVVVRHAGPGGDTQTVADKQR